MPVVEFNDLDVDGEGDQEHGAGVCEQHPLLDGRGEHSRQGCVHVLHRLGPQGLQPLGDPAPYDQRRVLPQLQRPERGHQVHLGLSAP